MDLNRKKIIAKEVLIFSSVIAIIFTVYCGLIIVENARKNNIHALNEENLKIQAKIDSLKENPTELSGLNGLTPPLPDGFTRIDEKDPFAEFGGSLIKTPWDQAKVEILYDAVSKDYKVGSLVEFIVNLQDSTKRKAFYDIASATYDLGDYTSFSDKVKISEPMLVKSKMMIDLINKLQSNERAIKNIQHLDKVQILGTLTLILLLIVYPIRGLILLIVWSIRIVKE